MNQAPSGLSKSPFATQPTGSDIFTGPQTANLIQSFKSGFAKKDAIITVAGPVGTGKTTLVNHALNVIAAKKKIVRVDRDSSAPKDLLEFLLIKLGVKNRPPEVKRRFAIFRNALQQYDAAGHSVIIVVEDIREAGAAMLAELAAVTAAGAGESGGARVVLMGSEDLEQTLDDPKLASLRDRIAHRHVINPLSDAETRAYLAHCFRASGEDFSKIFEEGSAELAHKLCDGNARAINQLVDAVLRAAAAQNIKPITTHFIADIAAHDYDPEGHDFSFTDVKPAVNDSDAAEPRKAASSAGEEVERIAEEIAHADSLDDFDDAMAETLFGPEIELFAIPTPRKN